MRKSFYILFLAVFLCPGCKQEHGTTLERILARGSAGFTSVLHNPRHEVQIIYGEIVGDSIVHHAFNPAKDMYFYPASTIKMPVAFAAFKRAQEEGISLDDYLVIDSTRIYPRQITFDSTFQDSITIRGLSKMIFTVSDNVANNILFGWLGKDYINQLYQRMDIPTRIVHQLGEGAFSFKPISNDYSRRTRFVSSGEVTHVFEEEEQSFQFGEQPMNQIKGNGYIDSLGNLVNEPFDFSKKNFIPLQSLISILEMGVRPDLCSSTQQLGLESKYQMALLETMDVLPANLPPPYDSLPDNYVKFLMLGTEQSGEIPSSLQIRNKVGWAYGYLSDIAYIEDTEKGIQFFLAAVIHVNDNQIYNDGVYQYEEIGLPFLDELGDLVYQYELEK